MIYLEIGHFEVPRYPHFVDFLNSEFVHEQAAAITDRLPVKDRVRYLYRLIYNRPANVEEQAFAKKYFAKDNSTKRWAGYVRSMLGSNEFMHVD